MVDGGCIVKTRACRDVGTILKLGGSPIGGSSRSVWWPDLTNLTYPKSVFFLGFRPLYFENAQKIKMKVLILTKTIF